jgi:hypothetical protein
MWDARVAFAFASLVLLSFEGHVKNDNGEYVVENVNLSVSCALIEVTGCYLDEVAGKKSTGEISLHAIKDLSDMESVNINLFTEMEYKRVMDLVAKNKMPSAAAKMQAQKEELAAFGVKGDAAQFENLNYADGAKTPSLKGRNWHLVFKKRRRNREKT